MDLYNLSLKTAPYPPITGQFVLPLHLRAPTEPRHSPEQDSLGTNPPASPVPTTPQSNEIRVLRAGTEAKMDRQRYQICSGKRGQGRYGGEAEKMEIISPTAAIILLA